MNQKQQKIYHKKYKSYEEKIKTIPMNFNENKYNL